MTILNGDLSRESTVKYDDREIQVTLTADQTIQFKLKGMKSGLLSIGIEELYKQLRGEDTKNDEHSVKPTGPISIKKKAASNDEGPMISLNSLRTHMLVTDMPRETKFTLESVLCEMLKQDVNLFTN
jgi:hypothetical protein